MEYSGYKNDYAGTVKGELVEIDRASLQIIRGKTLGNKNIYTVLLDEGIIYTISQDMSLKGLWTELRGETSQLYSDMLSELLAGIDESEIIRKKKWNTEKGG